MVAGSSSTVNQPSAIEFAVQATTYSSTTRSSTTTSMSTTTSTLPFPPTMPRSTCQCIAFRRVPDRHHSDHPSSQQGYSTDALFASHPIDISYTTLGYGTVELCASHAIALPSPFVSDHKIHELPSFRGPVANGQFPTCAYFVVSSQFTSTADAPAMFPYLSRPYLSGFAPRTGIPVATLPT